MATFMRVEFSNSLRPKTPKLVVIIEIPDNVAARLKANKLGHEARAYQVALQATEQEHGSGHGSETKLMSNTVGKVKDPAALGTPVFVAQDGCRAWIIKKP